MTNARSVSVAPSPPTVIGSEKREEPKPGPLEYTLRLQWVHGEMATLFQWGVTRVDGKFLVPTGHLDTTPEKHENEVNKGEAEHRDGWRQMATLALMRSSLNRDLPWTLESQEPLHDRLTLQPSATCKSNTSCLKRAPVLKHLRHSAQYFSEETRIYFPLRRNRQGSQATEQSSSKPWQNHWAPASESLRNEVLD